MRRVGMVFSQLLMALLVSLSLTAPVHAFPPLPSSFYGTVKVNGQNIPAGTPVRALIDGQAYASGTSLIYQGDSVYTLDVTGDNSDTPQKDGGRENDRVQFEVGGVLADQTGSWKSGTNTQLNLTLSTMAPLQTSQASPTVPAPSPSPTLQSLPAATTIPPSQTPQALPTASPRQTAVQTAIPPSPSSQVITPTGQNYPSPAASQPTQVAQAPAQTPSMVSPLSPTPVQGSLAQPASTQAPSGPAQPGAAGDPATNQPASVVLLALAIAGIAILASIATLTANRSGRKPGTNK